MKKMNYESPEFSFNEMRLAERVAEECWGLGHAYLDVNGDGIINAGDLQITLNGCSGAGAATAINDWFVDQGFQNPGYGPNVCNTKEASIIPSKS